VFGEEALRKLCAENSPQPEIKRHYDSRIQKFNAVSKIYY
jgi:hypothetical protein